MGGIINNLKFKAMPPIKTYTFENILNSNIKIEIKAYSQEQAMDILFMEVVCSNDYKQTNKQITP